MLSTPQSRLTPCQLPLHRGAFGTVRISITTERKKHPMDTILFSQPLSEADLDRAAAIIRRGGLLGIPTETVYGLGADGLNETAVLHIFEAKGRPQDNPLILHVPDAGWLPRYCQDIPAEAYALARHFWPGPLTMILPRREIVPLRTTGGLSTVGVRCPNHPLTLEIIRRAGVPIAAPSGNTSGRPQPHHCPAHGGGYVGQDRRHRGRRKLRRRCGEYHHRPDGDAAAAAAARRPAAGGPGGSPG